MKLTKAQAKAMNEVNRLVGLDRALTRDERVFVLENYQESTGGNNALAGAFFTPTGLAREFAIEVPGCKTLVDLCAGIGSLAYACEDRAERIVCVERNAEYVRVGRKVMPNATWIHADVFGDWIKEFGSFDFAISNPPFGNIAAPEWKGRYTGARFEYKVLELASRIARAGTFIVPQQSAPFRFSAQRQYCVSIDAQCQKFIDATGIDMEMNCGIDTDVFRRDWHGVSPICEIVTCDFDEKAEAVDAAPETRAEQGAGAEEIARAVVERASRQIEQMDLFADVA